MSTSNAPTKLAMVSVFTYEKLDLAQNFLESLRRFGIHKYHMSFVTDSITQDTLIQSGFNVTLLDTPKTGDMPPINALRYGVVAKILGAFSHVWLLDIESVCRGNLTAFFHYDFPKDIDIVVQKKDSHTVNPGCMIVKSSPQTCALFAHMSETKEDVDDSRVFTDIIPQVEPRLNLSFFDEISFPNTSIYFGPSEKHDEYVEHKYTPLIVNARFLNGIEQQITALKSTGNWLQIT
jgi:hypothetical protein